MNHSKFITAILAVATLTGAVHAEAADRRGGRRAVAGHAVPRGSVAPPVLRPVSPRIVRVAPYRPYYHPYRRGFGVGIYGGHPYRYAYPYAAYGYHPYSYGPYGYGLPPAAYIVAGPSPAYGSVRIEGAPRDSQVLVDGYYAGVVDDFDGAFQRLDLAAGPHRIEIRTPGYPPTAFDVRVEPGRTITYHAQ